MKNYKILFLLILTTHSSFGQELLQNDIKSLEKNKNYIQSTINFLEDSIIRIDNRIEELKMNIISQRKDGFKAIVKYDVDLVSETDYTKKTGHLSKGDTLLLGTYKWNQFQATNGKVSGLINESDLVNTEDLKLYIKTQGKNSDTQLLATPKPDQKKNLAIKERVYIYKSSSNRADGTFQYIKSVIKNYDNSYSEIDVVYISDVLMKEFEIIEQLDNGSVIIRNKEKIANVGSYESRYMVSNLSMALKTKEIAYCENFNSSLKKRYGEKTYQSIKQNKYWIGMSEEQLYISLGKPNKVNTTRTSTNTRKQYVYETYDIYAYVENGKVVSFQD